MTIKTKTEAIEMPMIASVDNSYFVGANVGLLVVGECVFIIGAGVGSSVKVGSAVASNVGELVVDGVTVGSGRNVGRIVGVYRQRKQVERKKFKKWSRGTCSTFCKFSCSFSSLLT